MKHVIIIITLIVSAILAGQWTVQDLRLPHQSKNQQKARLKDVPVDQSRFYRVTKVYDGDTIKLENGLKIRMIGIDTPESHANAKLDRDIQKHGKDKEVLLQMGQQAAVFSQKLLMNQRVRIELDVQPLDKYQRTLGYIYLEDGTFVNEKIIQEGYAYPLTIPPNVRYASLFQSRFKEARLLKKGLWK